MADTQERYSVMLTGGCGFIGSNVLLHLVPKYPHHNFVCYDSLEYCASVKNLDPIINAPNFKFIKGDICNSDLVTHVMRTEKVDVIMHFAAQTHVDNSFGNSFEFTRTNVLGTHVLLEAAKSATHKIKRFIHVSSDEVYGEVDLDKDRLDEEGRMNPTQPYAATKAAAEHLVISYMRSFQLPIIITRGNNVYGPCQFPEKVIPKFINLLFRGQKCTLHGKGEARRSFLYSTDVAAAFDTILHKGVIGEVYNIGTEDEISMYDMAVTLIKHMGMADRTSDLITYVPDRNFNDKRYAITTQKLRNLGWNQTIGFDDGLRMTIDWYRANPNNWGDVEAALVAHPRLTNTLRRD